MPNTNKKFIAYAYGIAADCYFQFFKAWDTNFRRYKKQFKAENEKRWKNFGLDCTDEEGKDGEKKLHNFLPMNIPNSQEECLIEAENFFQAAVEASENQDKKFFKLVLSFTTHN